MPGDSRVVEKAGIFRFVMDTHTGRLQDFKGGEKAAQLGGRPLIRYADADRGLEAMLVSLLAGGFPILGAGLADGAKQDV